MKGLMYLFLIGLTIVLQSGSIPVPQNCECSSTIMKCSKLELTGIPRCQEATYVELLDVSYNNIKVVTNSSFTTFPNVKEMHLNNAHIKWVEPDAFKSVPLLEKVDLSNNYLDYIEPNIFAGSTNLHTVILSNNPLQISQYESIIFSPSVATFDLSHCQIRKLSNAIFSGLPGLQTLDLSYNSLAHLSPDTFAGLKDLTVVDTTNNEWKCDQNFTTVMCWLHERGQDATIPARCYDKQHKKLIWTVESCMSVTGSAESGTTWSTTVQISTEESEEELTEPQTIVTQSDQHSTELSMETVTVARTEAQTSTELSTETVTVIRTEAQTVHRSNNVHLIKYKDPVPVPSPTSEPDGAWLFSRVFSVVDITFLTIVLITSIVGAIVTGRYIARHCTKEAKYEEILTDTPSEDNKSADEHIYEEIQYYYKEPNKV